MNIHEYIYGPEGERPLDRIVTDGGFFGIFRTVACIGDSLASGEFESDGKNGITRWHDYYEYSWGQYIGRSAGCKVYNFSRGGMTAREYMTSFADQNGFWDNRCKECQAFLIALGVNDIVNQKMPVGSVDDWSGSEEKSGNCKENITNEAQSFAYYYAQIIEKIKSIQPRAKIFLIGMPQHDDERDEGRRAVRDLLEAFTRKYSRTYLVDLFTYAPSNGGDFGDRFWFGHLSPAGYIVAARMIESYIDFIIRHHPKDFAQVGFIGTDLYYQPEE